MLTFFVRNKRFRFRLNVNHSILIFHKHVLRYTFSCINAIYRFKYWQLQCFFWWLLNSINMEDTDSNNKSFFYSLCSFAVLSNVLWEKSAPKLNNYTEWHITNMSLCKQEHFISKTSHKVCPEANINKWQTSFCKATAKESAGRGMGSSDEATRVLCPSPRAVFVKGIMGEATGKTTVGFHGNTNRHRQASQVFGGCYGYLGPEKSKTETQI